MHAHENTKDDPKEGSKRASIKVQSILCVYEEEDDFLTAQERSRILQKVENFVANMDGVNHQIPLGFDFPEFAGFNDQHSRGERPWRVISDVVRTPFLPLYKYHIIDLFYKLQAEELIKPTHSCTANTVGRCNKCMWCKEREWGFNQLGLTDPGEC